MRTVLGIARSSTERHWLEKVVELLPGMKTNMSLWVLTAHSACTVAKNRPPTPLDIPRWKPRSTNSNATNSGAWIRLHRTSFTLHLLQGSEIYHQNEV